MPFKPLKPCASPGCPRLTAGRYCDEHQQTEGAKYYRYGRDPETRKRYDARWTRIRAAFLREHPLCEECAKAGRTIPAREVHHVKPLSDGGTHDTENLMALCKSCHSAITLAATHRRTPPPYGGKNLQKLPLKERAPDTNEKSRFQKGYIDPPEDKRR